MHRYDTSKRKSYVTQYHQGTQRTSFSRVETLSTPTAITLPSGYSTYALLQICSRRTQTGLLLSWMGVPNHRSKYVREYQVLMSLKFLRKLIFLRCARRNVLILILCRSRAFHQSGQFFFFFLFYCQLLNNIGVGCHIRRFSVFDEFRQ